MKLTEKQKRFADFYIETGNAAESAVRAGYSEKTAKEIGCENLTKPNIRQYIDERIAEKDSRRIASQDEVLEYLTKVLRGEETERIPIVGKDYFEMIDNTPSVKDRTKAAELLGKRYAMWTDKQQIEGMVPVTIVNDLND
jgi:phage terminase small subunit